MTRYLPAKLRFHLEYLAILVIVELFGCHEYEGATSLHQQLLVVAILLRKLETQPKVSYFNGIEVFAISHQDVFRL